jgi:hypothetical protein
METDRQGLFSRTIPASRQSAWKAMDGTKGNQQERVGTKLLSRSNKTFIGHENQRRCKYFLPNLRKSPVTASCRFLHFSNLFLPMGIVSDEVAKKSLFAISAYGPGTPESLSRKRWHAAAGPWMRWLMRKSTGSGGDFDGCRFRRGSRLPEHARFHQPQ